MLAVIGAILLAFAGIITGVNLYLFVNGAVVIAALLFERGRYRPTVSPDGPCRRERSLRLSASTD